MTHKEYSIWCSKQGLNPYLKSSQDKWEKRVKTHEKATLQRKSIK